MKAFDPLTVEDVQDAIKSIFGPVPINTPRNRDGSFSPQIVPKRVTDVSSIENKVLAMYAKGMSQRDISDMTMKLSTVPYMGF